uniref:Uncharacterized protein n=1 Tax=Magnetococcus massalia (strain MO-1) TaxID=451514 RepID=A0A1S7LG22_MAGMO|nr:Protein of unknown function [Candidatus Magnetococcus massalia]
MTHAIDGTVGVEFTKRTTAAEFALGHTVRGSANTLWIYVQASEAVATGTCTVNSSTFLLTDAAGNHTAETAFASGEYGWVRQTTGMTV